MANIKVSAKANVNFTSFHDVTIYATLNQLVEALGKATVIGSGDDKVQFEWDFEVEGSSTGVTLYDWKEYDWAMNGCDPDTELEWHFGGPSYEVEEVVKEYVNSLLK